MVIVMDKNLILAIDVGTTNCRAAVVDSNGKILALAYRPITLISPEKGWFEICPRKLWDDISSLITTVSKGYKHRLLTCGITVQRNTFITWNKENGNYLHNFITWLDMRSTSMCTEWNKSYLINAGKWAAWMLGSVVGSRHLICASTFAVKEKAIPMRLKWVLENVKEARQLQKAGKLCFGTIDTWLVWKLTCGDVWATDYSCASSTGIFDIWKQAWCPIMTYLFSNPMNILPEVKDSNAYYGIIDESLNFGFSIPITGVIGDQQASIFGNQLFEEGDIKLTLGTGIACNVNTGKKTHPTSHDIYPLIGWKLAGHKVFYIAELLAANGGRAVEWAVTSGLIEDIKNIDHVARSVPDSAGVSFVPAFNGMEVPYKDPFAGTSLFGISLRTTTANLVRAVLESQTFISRHVLDLMFGYYGKPRNIRVDGGASRSTFIVENIADLCTVDIDRSDCVEGSLIGASLLAGLGIGLYRSVGDIKNKVHQKLDAFEKSDTPSSDLDEGYENWCASAERCVDWGKQLP